MSSIRATMTDDHRRCDRIFADAEAAVSQRDWPGAGGHFSEFREAMERHFGLEEQVLFPALEARAGGALGPTQVMRMEHAQMRQLLVEMSNAADRRDQQAYLGAAETLMIVMQQHNMKEEQILYRMTDEMLADQAPQLLERLGAC
jgi:iron-sulfur cluster repair protein YtfE (RIC family)